MGTKTTRSRMSGAVGEVLAEKPAAEDEKKRADRLSRLTLENFLSIGRPSAAMRVLVHSEAKVGKTTFFAHVPNVVFLAVEEGCNQYKVPQWKEPIRTLEDFEAAIEKLRYGQHAFEAVAIDTLDALEELVRGYLERKLREIAKTVKGGDAPKNIAELNEEEYGAGYDLLRDTWKRILGALDVLRDERGMHVLVACHTKSGIERVFDGELDYPRHEPQITGKKSALLIKAWFDYILFFKTEIFVTKGKGSKILTSQGERYMHCTAKATHVAGCRGEVEWPDRLVLDKNEGWKTFVGTRALVEAHGSKLPEALAARVEPIAARLPTERSKAFREAFGRALLARNYFGADEILVAGAEEADEVAVAAGDKPAAAAATATPANGTCGAVAS